MNLELSRSRSKTTAPLSVRRLFLSPTLPPDQVTVSLRMAALQTKLESPRSRQAAPQLHLRLRRVRMLPEMRNSPGLRTYGAGLRRRWRWRAFSSKPARRPRAKTRKVIARRKQMGCGLQLGKPCKVLGGQVCKVVALMERPSVCKCVHGISACSYIAARFVPFDLATLGPPERGGVIQM